jgi:HK97 family phage major capsid protein
MRTTPLTTLLERRAAAFENHAEAARRPGADTSATVPLLREHADELDAELRTRWPNVDPTFRGVFAYGGTYETSFDINTRALTASARAQLSDRTFVEALFAKAVEAAPLLDWATLLETGDALPFDFGFLNVDATAPGVIDDGATITAGDPGFARASFGSFAYKAVIAAAAELVVDARLDLERLAAEHVAPILARKLSSDLWGGGGTTEPQGLLAGLGTVTAAGASAVTLADVAKLLAAVPAADRFGGDCVVMMSPGAFEDIAESQASIGNFVAPAAFGIRPEDLSLGVPRYHGIITSAGVPFVIDPALAAPASAAKSVVAGSIRQAYAVRLAPLRVDVDKVSASTDTVSLRCVLRADGRRMRTGAARALVHP